MNITVNSSKLKLNNGDVSFTKEEAVKYIKEEVDHVLDSLGVDYIVDIKLYTEGEDNDPVHKIDIKAVNSNNIIIQSAYSRNMKRAINKALPDFRRQLKRAKTKIIDKRRSDTRKTNSIKEDVEFVIQAI